MQTRYWNPRTETLPREQLDALQLAKLRDVVDWALATSRRQARRLREAGIDSSASFRSHDDIRRIPFLTPEDWLENQGAASTDPLSQSVDAAIRKRGGGDAGPLAIVEGTKDWEWIAEMWCYALWGFGIRRSDRILFALSYGAFAGFWGAHYAAEKLECLILADGNVTIQGRIKMIEDAQATVVCSTPSYALRMAQEARTFGIDLASGPVKKLILSGEPSSSNPTTKALIEEQWGAEAADIASLAEVGTITMFECDRHPGGGHLIEDHYLEEVVDPESGEPVGPHEEGERVVTSFGRGPVPLMRYRTRELVRRIPAERCRCGRTFDIYEGGIRGRVDHVTVVRGHTVHPRRIEQMVRARAEITQFQVRLFTVEDDRDEIEVLIESVAGDDATAILIDDLRHELALAHDGLDLAVREVKCEALRRGVKVPPLLDERRAEGIAIEERVM